MSAKSIKIEINMDIACPKCGKKGAVIGSNGQPRVCLKCLEKALKITKGAGPARTPKFKIDNF